MYNWLRGRTSCYKRFGKTWLGRPSPRRSGHRWRTVPGALFRSLAVSSPVSRNLERATGERDAPHKELVQSTGPTAANLATVWRYRS